MNRVLLIGRTTKDIDLRNANDEERAVARFTLAINRRGKDNKADFINCVAFRKSAIGIAKYVTKGMRIGVEGHIMTGSYKSQSGSTVYTTDVIVDSWEFADVKNSWEALTADVPADEFKATEDEELPFN